MMGRSHALSGWCAGVVLAPVAGLTTVAEVVPFAVATAGYALVPDLDHPHAKASRLLGPLTRVVSSAVRGFSSVLYNLTKGPRDEKSTGKHRHATHTLAAAVGLGFLAAGAGASGGRWAVLAIAVAGLLLAADVLGDWIIGIVLAATAWSVFGSSTTGGVLPGTPAADALQAGLAEIGSWIGLAVTAGMFVHCLGDSLTRAGCPWLWPVPIRGETWYEIRLPRLLRFRTGGWVERLLIAPALAVAGLWFVPGVRELIWQFAQALLFPADTTADG